MSPAGWVKASPSRPGRAPTCASSDGELQAGDDLSVVYHRHGVTVSTMFRAFTTERARP